MASVTPVMPEGLKSRDLAESGAGLYVAGASIGYVPLFWLLRWARGWSLRAQFMPRA